MAQLAGKSVVAINQLAVDDDAATYARTQRDHDEVLHTTGRAVGHFADGGRVGVVGQSRRYAQALFEQSSQGNDTLPRKVGSKLDGTRIIVAVGGTHADTLDFIFSAIGFEQGKQVLANFVHVCFHFRISARLDRAACNHRSTRIYNAEYSIRTAYVDTHHIGFLHVRIHDILFCLKG